MAKQSNEAGNLHNIGIGISMYRQDHKGDYPPDLQAVAKDYIPDSSTFTSPSGPDVRLIYTPPGKDAKPTDVVAYFWRPGEGSANVLFAVALWIGLSRAQYVMHPPPSPIFSSGILSLQLFFIGIVFLTMVASYFMTRWWLQKQE